MANLSTSSMFGKHIMTMQDDYKNSKLFSIPFSELDVLELQQIFVALGVHTIKAKNVADGRAIIATILQSLNYYHTIGCVTQVVEPVLAVNVCDILGQIMLQHDEKGDLITDLEDFFSMYACFDFIWIEFTQAMRKRYSYDALKKIFDMYHAEERMPVVIVMYEEE